MSDRQLRKFAFGLITAALVGLVGWIANTHYAVAQLQANQDNLKDQVDKIERIVILLHQGLLGPVPERKK